MREKYRESGFGDIVLVKGIVCEYFDWRIDPESVPPEKHMYEVRHTEEDWGEPCQIKNRVLDNFMGTLICDQELTLDETGRLELEEDDFEFDYCC